MISNGYAYAYKHCSPLQGKIHKYIYRKDFDSTAVTKAMMDDFPYATSIIQVNKIVRK